MPQLIWSPEALRDVQHLYRFLAQKNPEAASRAVGSIRKSMQIVADHPEAGRAVDDMDPDYREWPIPFGSSGYIALYRLKADRALVIAIRNQKEAGYRQP